MRKKTLIIVITIIIIALIGGVIYGVLSAKNKKENPDESVVTLRPKNSGVVTVPKIEGNTELSEDRKDLLDENILKLIEINEKGSYAFNSKGYVLADENGELQYENLNNDDYANYKHNLIVIINILVDEDYTKVAIEQVQRFYYHYALSLASYDKETTIKKLKRCFPKQGTTQQNLVSNANIEFGIMSTDKFKAVFEPSLTVDDEIPKFSGVAPYVKNQITEVQEKICIYDIYISPTQSDYDGYLESFLHIIIDSFSKNEYTEDETILAQLVFATALFDKEYSPNYIEKIIKCIPKEGVTYDNLKNSVMSEFNTDISGNLFIINYLNGTSDFKELIKD